MGGEMNKLFLMSLIMPFLFCGCQTTKTRAVEGAAIGGILGAGAGYAIGQATHHGAEGAGIGAAVGAISGTLIGSQIEKPNPSGSSADPYNPKQMSIQEVVELSRQGIHPEVIIDRIRLTNSKFNLTPQDIEYLREEGVSEKVINAMQGRL